MAALTPTEFIQTLELMKEELNEPDLVCHYLMQLNLSVDMLRIQVASMFRDKDAPPIKEPTLGEYKLVFNFDEKTGDKTRTETPEELDRKKMDLSKSRWMGGVGLKRDGTPRVKKEEKEYPPDPPRRQPKPKGKRR